METPNDKRFHKNGYFPVETNLLLAGDLMVKLKNHHIIAVMITFSPKKMTLEKLKRVMKRTSPSLYAKDAVMVILIKTALSIR